MSTLKIASIRKKGNSFEVLQLKEMPIDAALPISGSNGIVSTSVCAKDVLIRPIETPLKKERDIQASLEFQAESHIPYPIKEAVVQGMVVKKKPHGTLLTVAAVRKNHLQSHFNLLKKIKIEPDVVTSAHFALAALSTILPHQPSTNLYIYIGEKVVTCALVENGALIRGYAFDANSPLKQEVQKTVLALNASLKTKTFDSIFLFGKANLETLNLIAEATQKSVHFPFSPYLTLAQDELMRYALAIGTALSGIENSTPNFRQKEFSYPHPFKRIKKPLTILLSGVFALSLSLFCLAKFSIADKKDRIANRYQVLLAQENKPFNELHSLEDYRIALANLEKEIEKKPDTFALYPSVPKVREVMGWISSFPIAINVDSFHYNMIKRPSFSQKNERYQVKVFLEFSTQSATEARSFHEILLAPNAFVDTKQEVQWTMTRDGKYRTSFYLKDKTRYV